MVKISSKFVQNNKIQFYGFSLKTSIDLSSVVIWEN